MQTAAPGRHADLRTDTLLEKLARNGVYEIRNAIFELWSSEISEIGLVPALRRMTREFQRIASIETDFGQGDVRRLPTHTETVLYRVTRRRYTTLSNTRRPLAWISRRNMVPGKSNCGSPITVLGSTRQRLRGVKRGLPMDSKPCLLARER